MLAVLDTNCFIDAVTPASHEYDAVTRLLAASATAQVTLMVSRHTFAEILTPAARDLAASLPCLPHRPIGTWDDQVTTWNDLDGTWEDAAWSEAIQREIHAHAKKGADLRDRGSYLDAILGHANIFVTSDGHLVKPGPASRLAGRFGVRVLTPSALVRELHL
ncbi:MAG: hypothetical protein ACREPM_11585 [Gemmatimonadaceae bacterium]